MNTVHNTRIVRFLVMLTAVVLLIFIYASYSSNTSMAPPHMRTALVADAPLALVAAPLNSPTAQQQLNRTDAAYASAESANRIQANDNQISRNDGSSDNMIAAHLNPKTKSSNGKPLSKKQHREPTIAIDALIDGDAVMGGAGGGGGGAGGDIGGGRSGAVIGGGVGAAPGGGPVDDVPDEGNDDDDDDLLEYVQNVDNSLGNTINNSASSGGVHASVAQQAQKTGQQQQQPQVAQPKTQQQIQQQNHLTDKLISKIPDSDVLIPTSNLQKFIENADKILKNISSGPSPAAGSNTSSNKVNVKEPVKAKEPKNSKQVAKTAENSISDGNDDEALPPSVIMTIKQSKPVSQPVAPATVAVKSNTPDPKPNYDTAQGIPTQKIYERGHMNEEINIEKICPKRGADLKLLILITSAHAHAEARLAIRQTWAHYGTRRDISTAFVLGRTTNETLNRALTQENFIYGDLIRGHSMDTYNNLTLKTISLLEWMDEQCPRANYLLKTDDDMFINVPKLLAFLDSHSKEKRVIFGRLAKKWKPIRNIKSKYYVSPSQYGAPVYPPFTTGPAYVLTSDIVHELYVRCLHQVYLKLEDVFTTGIVAQQLGIRRVHVNEFLNRRITFNPCNIRKTISVHMVKVNEQFDLWKKLLDQTTKCK